MKSFIAFAALFAVALAAPQFAQPGEQVVLVRGQEHNNIGVDGYQYNYELSDGQARQEVAELVQPRAANEDAFLRVTGSYSFVGDDGVNYLVTYYADDTGFHAEGAHLPKA